MKKKFLAMLLCGVMAMASLTACGSSEKAEETAEAVVEEVTEMAEDASAMCSDESFAALQDAFANLTEGVNLVENYYLENPDVPQSDDVEAALQAAHEYLDEVGVIKQEEITEAEAEALAQSMVDVAGSLETLATSLVDVASPCSDDTFAALQDTYASLYELNESVVNYYLENPDIPQDDDVEAALNQAKEYLDQVGALNQVDITEAEAVALAQSMSDVAEGLAAMAEAMVQ